MLNTGRFNYIIGKISFFRICTDKMHFFYKNEGHGKSHLNAKPTFCMVLLVFAMRPEAVFRSEVKLTKNISHAKKSLLHEPSLEV